MMQRSSGVLLHLTSLPSAYGIGDMGPDARQFIDFLAESGQTYWQVLPLNPTNAAHGNSPYSSSSAFAGNILLLSPQKLVDDGLLVVDEIRPEEALPDDRVAYDAVIRHKLRVADAAWKAFQRSTDRTEFEQFCASASHWLDDFALFVAIKKNMGDASWIDWPEEYRDREPDALKRIRAELSDRIEREKFLQFLFMKQWRELKEYANEKGVKIFGDIPIYVNLDSADVWANSRFFKLEPDKSPSAVAGVPPDYFSKTGQLWGNPVYDWAALKENGYQWWIERMRHVLILYDIVRIDHFRGLIAYWEVPAGHKTAVDGEWVNVPFDDFYATLEEHLDGADIVAEDLGTITDDVTEAMARFHIPGMKILLFAFGEDNPEHPYLPENYDPESVVYTGTHDNNTVLGWWNEETDDDIRRRVSEYLDKEINADDLPWDLIACAFGSVASMAVVPMQDLLSLGADARMNTPATSGGNWGWRLLPGQIKPELVERLRAVTDETGRLRK